MSLTEAVVHVFQNYANFNGRARRSEYWYFQIFNKLLPGLVTFLAIIPVMTSNNPGDTAMAAASVAIIFVSLYELACIIPSLALLCRRLHDIGKPGAYMFFFMLPAAGWILELVWTFQDSDPGENRYGPNPKGEAYTVSSAPRASRCPYCGAAVSSGSTFCGKCGKSLAGAAKPAGWVCVCGRRNAADSAFCPACGRRKGGEDYTPPRYRESPPTPPRDRESDFRYTPPTPTYTPPVDSKEDDIPAGFKHPSDLD